MKYFKSIFFICIFSMLFAVHAEDNSQKGTTAKKADSLKTTTTAKSKTLVAPAKTTTRAIPKTNWSKIKDMFM